MNPYVNLNTGGSYLMAIGLKLVKMNSFAPESITFYLLKKLLNHLWLPFCPALY